MIFCKININDINEYNKVIWQYALCQVLFQINLLTAFTDRNWITNYSSLLKSKILTACVNQ